MRLLDISKQEYGGSWEVTEREALEGIEDVKSIEVTERDFRQDDGTTRTRVSMCFTMKNGRTRYVPLSRDSELEVGDKVDPASVEVLTLERDGDEPIYRVDGEVLKTKKGKK